MTREEAIKEFRNNVDRHKKWSMFEYCFEEFICDIFNDFEKEKQKLIEGQNLLIKAHEGYIEDVMNRTCENCKYECFEFGTCSKLNYYITKDFGCNKWESKDEQ